MAKRAAQIVAGVPCLALFIGLTPAASSAARHCGTVEFPSGYNEEELSLRVEVVKGRTSCAEARRVMLALYVGNRGRPYCYRHDSSCRNDRLRTSATRSGSFMVGDVLSVLVEAVVHATATV